MCDFSDIFPVTTLDENEEVQAELDELYDTLVAYKGETDMPAELVKRTDIGAVEFWSLESERFMGVMYVKDGPDNGSLTVQNDGHMPRVVPDWHTGIGVLIMGFLFGDLIG